MNVLNATCYKANFNWVELKDVGFIQQYVHWAASSLVDRRELPGAVQSDFYRQKGAEQEALLGEKGGRVGISRSLPF